MQQEEERIAWEDAWHDTGYCFTQPDGTVVSPEQVSGAFEKVAFEAGLPPVTLRDLRHCAPTYALAAGEDDRYENLKRLANRVYQRYVAKTSGSRGDVRIPLPPYDTLNAAVVRQLLDPQNGAPYVARAVLRTQLGLPAETAAPVNTTTNAVEIISTNAIPTNAVAPVLP